MRKNVKIYKIYKKRNKLSKINKFLLKKIAHVSYLLGKCLKVEVHKMLGRQTNVYVSTFK